MKNIFTVSPGTDFIQALTQGLWRQANHDPLTLASIVVFLPNRRACHHLRESFARYTPATLLPRLCPLGEVDEDELDFALNDNSNISPAITPMRRQMLLACLVQRKDPSLTLDQATLLAEALARLLDEVQIARRDLHDLGTLVQKRELAQHWQETVRFLSILTDTWPNILRDEGCLDPMERRNLIIEKQIAAWRETPPQHPILAAGSTGSLPSTADLLIAISDLPQGMVILPGLDQDLSEDAWQQIGDTHPQVSMKELLERMGIPRSRVRKWPEDQGHQNGRVRLLQESMRPAAVSESWRELSATNITRHDIRGLSHLVLDHPQEEAEAIALILRETLETPRRTATLVTPDRALAERVAATLLRWNITINDSGGSPLVTQTAGSFLVNVLKAAHPESTAIDLLSLLKHPLAALGLAPAECRSQARHVEMVCIRSKAPLESKWLSSLYACLSPLTKTWHDLLPLEERIDAHIALAEHLASTDEFPGHARLWQDEAGEKTAEWMSVWRGAAKNFPHLSGNDYVGLLTSLMRATTFRHSYGQHPRLAILGPLEARLMQADTIILGGLNEGVWPPETPVDPWMSRPMKRDFSLALPERRIGLSAHDFVQLASAPNVILTRARRSGNAPTVPSRFLLQLDVVLHALQHSTSMLDALASEIPWGTWARRLDTPETLTHIKRPEPRPELKYRPTQLPVTKIGIWLRNPYAIYAEYILKLKKLEPLEEDVDDAERGTMIHKALEEFLRPYCDHLPKNALEELIAVGHRIFSAYDAHPKVQAIWWPRFENIAEWFITHEKERREKGIFPIAIEAKGELRTHIKSAGSEEQDIPFVLTGRVDRMDRMAAGAFAIIDYKTGGVATQKEVVSGLEPQLPLLALIANLGGFPGLPEGKAQEIAYWKLGGGTRGCNATPIHADIDLLVQDAEQGLYELVRVFADSSVPYLAVPRAGLAPRYDDYAHLARIAEWGRTRTGRGK